MPTRPKSVKSVDRPDDVIGLTDGIDASQESASREAEPPAGLELQVLLVEDNVDDAELIACELARCGFHATCVRVETATDLKTALGRQRWDLVLTDYTMPGLDAPAVFELIRDHCKDVPSILVSGTASDETARAAMKLGLDDFVNKQHLNALGEVVARNLSTAQTRRARRDVPRVRLQGGQEFQVTDWSPQRAVLEGSRLSPGHTRDALLLTDEDVARVSFRILSCEVQALSGTELVYQSIVTMLTDRNAVAPVRGGFPPETRAVC